jgi:hypothetical protein
MTAARLALLLGLAACATEPSAVGRPLALALSDQPVTLVGAGDIHARCALSHASAKTARLVDSTDDVVFTVGDNAGVDGTAADFACFDGTWGAFRARLRMSEGNHEHRLDPASTAYFDYGATFDHDATGPRGKGYYAYTPREGWRVLVLDSERAKTEQPAWIAADLAAHPVRCQLAMWHKPLFNSGSSVSSVSYVRPFWRELYAAGADIVINGHDHSYQRTTLVDPWGTPTPGGLREFIVGTGGGVLGGFLATPLAMTERMIAAHGVLRLTLNADSYDWEFVDINGNVRDSGSEACHD